MRSVASYDGDMRKRLPQLPSRCLSGMPATFSSCFAAHAQALARVVPELDARIVEIEYERLLARWDLADEEAEPLPHSCCLFGRKVISKKGPFLAAYT